MTSIFYGKMLSHIDYIKIKTLDIFVFRNDFKSFSLFHISDKGMKGHYMTSIFSGKFLSHIDHIKIKALDFYF